MIEAAMLLTSAISPACIRVRDQPSTSALSAQGVDQLVKALDSVDKDSRVRAAERLASLGAEAKPAGDALAKKAVKDPEAEVRAWAIAALSELGPKYRSVLFRGLRDKDGTVRQVAARVIGEHRPVSEAATRRLRDALKDPDRGVRVASARSLVCIGVTSTEVLAVLVEAANHADWLGLARIDAIETLGLLDIRGVPTLTELLKDKRADVRAAAAAALGQVGPAARSAIPLLEDVLRDKDEDVRASALAALARIRE